MSHKQAKRDRIQARLNVEKQAIQQDVKLVYGKLPEGEDQQNIAAVLKENNNESGIIIPNDSYIPPTSALTSHSGFLVENWRSGWKWISNIALTAIVAVNAAPIPMEIIAALPNDAQTKVTIALGIIGVLGRFINQSRGKEAEVMNGY